MQSNLRQLSLRYENIYNLSFTSQLLNNIFNQMKILRLRVDPVVNR